MLLLCTLPQRQPLRGGHGAAVPAAQAEQAAQGQMGGTTWALVVGQRGGVGE